jgi:succinyl-CoA synthetase beta subunit
LAVLTDFFSTEFDGKSIFAKWLNQRHKQGKYVDNRVASVTPLTDLNLLVKDHPWLLTEKLVIKVDQLVKRRGKLGLVKV